VKERKVISCWRRKGKDKQESVEERNVSSRCTAAAAVVELANNEVQASFQTHTRTSPRHTTYQQIIGTHSLT